LIIFYKVILLSQNRPTYAANYYTLSNLTFYSKAAVDGNFNGNIYGGNDEINEIYNLTKYYKTGSCYHSLSINSEKWWVVILDSLSVITMVRIYNRLDCCSYLLSFALIILFFYFIADRTGKLMFYFSPEIYINFTTDSDYFYKFNYFKGPAKFKQAKIDFNYTRVVNIKF